MIKKFNFGSIILNMIKDIVRVRIEAGDGGNGGVHFSKGVKKYPTGGNGGDGGDVFVIGSTEIQDLRSFDEGKILAAESGESGGPNRKQGADGKDIVIKLPVLTEVYDQNEKLMCIVDRLDKKILIRRAGEGGIGNWHFRAGVDGKFDHFTKGKKGEKFNVILKFKLIADIVFIGFPNAGKSSMLNSLTNANVKVGSYAFTTLNPHLGRMREVTLMDLPGLIEGTSEGKGLGTKFLQHTHYSKLVAHFISLESNDLVKDYKIMRTELKNIDEKLFNKKEILVLTKSDEFTSEEIEEKLKQIKSLDLPYVLCSTIDDNSLKELELLFRKSID